jgi:cytochrome c peroxidase
MKTFCLTLVAICLLVSCGTRNNEQSLREINGFLLTEASSMASAIDSMKVSLEKGASETEVTHHFVSARERWKHIEPIVEFHFAGVADAINGPALPEDEESDDKVIDPTGFQVIEELIYPTYDTTTKVELLTEITTMQALSLRLVSLIESNTLNEQNVFEAARLQLLRIAALGVSGFDSPIANLSIGEAKASIRGLKSILATFDSDDKLEKAFSKTLEYLEANDNFFAFNRGEFIADYLKPLASEIYRFQLARHIPNNTWTGPIDMNESDIFDADNFQVEHFAPLYSREHQKNEAVILLGKTLFFDPILSGNNSRSCASCHNPEKAFTDNRTKSIAFNFAGTVVRNAPTLINSGFQRAQFADSRVAFLEDQVSAVISNKSELHSNAEESFRKIVASDEYVALLQKAFPNQKEFNSLNVQQSLAAYVRSLSGFNSRFDRYMRGEKNAMSRMEVEGFNLFMGKAKCGTCHFMPLFNGTIPPGFTKTESEVLGVPVGPTTNVVDPDEGKYRTTGKQRHRFMFKTPTVRNASLTAPYMHNGGFKTLEEILDFYNNGGGYALGIELENQTLPLDTLGLTGGEKKKIIAFIHTLTDTAALDATPVVLPKFANTQLNDRKVGGVY